MLRFFRGRNGQSVSRIPCLHAPVRTTVHVNADSPMPRSLFARLKLHSVSQITLDPEQSDKFKRWRLIPSAVLTHASLGSVFAWSIFNDPLTHALGVVVPAAGDYALTATVPIFSVTFATFGLSSAVLGYLGAFEKLGPRRAVMLGAVTYGAAFSVASAGVLLHQLPLIYMGYGLLGGLATGLAYVPAVATLLKWFPDRKGLAGALVIMGFGGGGMICSVVGSKLLALFAKAPVFLGPAAAVSTVTRDGRLFVDAVDGAREVVVATMANMSQLPEGVYVVGTGSTGLLETWMCLGATYTAAILLSSLAFRLPAVNWTPPGWTAPAVSRGSVVSYNNVSPRSALRTPQFWLLWTAMTTTNASAYAILGAGKTIVGEIFSGPLPLIVTGGFTTAFVTMLSAANLTGRVAWGAVSDVWGRRRTFMAAWGLGVPMYLGIPLSVHLVTDSPSALALALFCTCAFVNLSIFGATAAVLPAYVADLMGPKYAGAMHGLLLSSVVVAGTTGPALLATLRQWEVTRALEGLVAHIDAATFHATFGAPLSELPALIEAKTVTIARLLAIAPPGALDPTPFLYDKPMYTYAALQAVALGCNFFITPVDAKHHEK